MHCRNRYSGVEGCHYGAGCDPDSGAPTSHLRQLQRPVVDLQRGPQVERLAGERGGGDSRHCVGGEERDCKLDLQLAALSSQLKLL